MLAKLHSIADGDGNHLGYMIECPGCGQWHAIYTEITKHNKVKWDFNGDLDRPSFHPSIRAQWTQGPEHTKQVCHFFITDGMIQFCGDSTHSLADKTVALKEWE